MKSISKLKVGVGAVVFLALIAVVGAKVVTSPTDSYLADRKMAAEAVNAAPMEDRAELDKKYTAELNAKLVKLVWVVKANGFSGKVRLLVTIVQLLKAWVATADAGLKSTDDVAVIFDSEAFYTDVFGDDAASFRFASCR